MRIHAQHLPVLRTAAIATFGLASAGAFGVLWVNMGGQIPGVTGGYQVEAVFDEVGNLVYDSDVRMAGVRVGKIRGLETSDGGAVVTLELRGNAAPLHEGAVMRIGTKTLIGENYVDVVDGGGDPIPAGSRLPDGAVKDSVELDEVLNSLDETTRERAGSLVRAMGASLDGGSEELAAVVAGLGQLGREGHDALDVLAAQSEDLRQLVHETTQLLELLDEGDGQIARLATAAERVTRATGASATELERTMRQLPDLLENTEVASGELRHLGDALAPVARDLRAASTDLNQTLVDAEPLAADLRGLLPALDGSLERAPATLERVRPAARVVRALVPTARAALAEVNPVLSYLAPYAPDVAGFVTNWNDALSPRDALGHYVRIRVLANDQSAKASPAGTDELPVLAPIRGSNAYPGPGAPVDPGPFTGQYPRVGPDEP